MSSQKINVTIIHKGGHEQKFRTVEAFRIKRGCVYVSTLDNEGIRRETTIVPLANVADITVVETFFDE